VDFSCTPAGITVLRDDAMRAQYMLSSCVCLSVRLIVEYWQSLCFGCFWFTDAPSWV